MKFSREAIDHICDPKNPTWLVFEEYNDDEDSENAKKTTMEKIKEGGDDYDPARFQHIKNFHLIEILKPTVELPNPCQIYSAANGDPVSNFRHFTRSSWLW